MGVNMAMLFVFMFAVGRHWQLWERVTLYVVVSIFAQEAIAQIFMRFEPVKKDMKHEDVA